MSMAERRGDALQSAATVQANRTARGSWSESGTFPSRTNTSVSNRHEGGASVTGPALRKRNLSIRPGSGHASVAQTSLSPVSASSRWNCEPSGRRSCAG